MDCSQAIELTDATPPLVVCVTSDSIWWLTPVIFTISLCVAIFGVITARAVARQRATLDLIEKTETSEVYNDIKATFLYYSRTEKLHELHDPQEGPDKDARDKVMTFLNHYELVSIGIRNNILDRKFYMEWMRGPMVDDWNRAADFIQRERWKWSKSRAEWIYYDSTFCAFAKLAREMSPKDAKKIGPHLPKPAHGPAGIGDERLPSPPEDI